MGAPRLLLVEDDPALAELLEFRFRAEGYDVAATADGDEALLLAAEEVPDLVVLDWMIEGTSGIEVCRRLRSRSETRNVPIIILTARGEVEISVQLLRESAHNTRTPMRRQALMRGTPPVASRSGNGRHPRDFASRESHPRET